MNNKISPFIFLVLITFLAICLRFYQIDSFPPSLSGDEILETTLARDAWATRQFPIYFPADFGGTHPFLVYLTLLARFITNNHVLTIRFVVAAIGVLSVPIVYWALTQVFALESDWQAQAQPLALLGALAFTIALPSFTLHRLALEVTLPAPMSALAFGWLALGYRTQRLRHYLLAGVATGVALYMAYVARLLPFVMGLALGGLWLILPRMGRSAHERGSLGLIGAAGLIFAPLGWFFITHWDVFITRSNALTTGLSSDSSSQTLALLIKNTFHTIASISLPGYGDLIARHNLPGHPVFDAFLSLLFWLGAWQVVNRWQRSAAYLLSVWMVGLMLPSIITMGNASSPHLTRMYGALPAQVGLVALGAWAVGVWLRQLWGKRVALIGLGLGFCFSLISNAYACFVSWPQDPDFPDSFQIVDWQAAQLAQERSQTDIVYVLPDLLTTPARNQFDLLLKGSTVRAYLSLACEVYINQPTRPLTFIIDVLIDPRGVAPLRELYPEGRESNPLLRQPPPGWPLYAIYQVPAGARVQPLAHQVSVRFGNSIQLAGLDLSAQSLRPGETLTMTLDWLVLNQPVQEYIGFIHAFAPNIAEPITQADASPCNSQYSTLRWLTGETIRETRSITVPPDYNGTTLEIGLGMYAWPSLERLPINSAEAKNQIWPLAQISVQP